jgi:hypothetical protein
MRTVVAASPGSTHTSGPTSPFTDTARQQPYHAVQSPVTGAALD